MKKVQIIGILNITNDSFFDKGAHFALDAAIKRAFQMVEEGADLIEIGGESTRPFSDPVSLEEEIRRVQPVLKILSKELPRPLSIDTMKPEIADLACKMGVTLLNDVNGFRDKKMVEVGKHYGAKVCLMHIQGTPKTMQVNPHYPQGVVPEVTKWLQQAAAELIKAGIAPHNIILDPGIGFGKTVAHNYEITQNLHVMKELGFPLLFGISRKSCLGKVVGKPPGELLAPTVAMNTIAWLKGVSYIRVHDVKEHKDALLCLEQLAGVS